MVAPLVAAWYAAGFGFNTAEQVQPGQDREQALRNLQEQVNQLQKRTDQLQAENGRLNEQKDRFQKQTGTLTARNEKLKKRNDRTRTEYEKLAGENKKLTGKIEALQETRKRLTDENQRLKQKGEDWRNEIGDNLARIARLEEAKRQLERELNAERDYAAASRDLSKLESAIRQRDQLRTAQLLDDHFRHLTSIVGGKDATRAKEVRDLIDRAIAAFPDSPRLRETAEEILRGTK